MAARFRIGATTRTLTVGFLGGLAVAAWLWSWSAPPERRRLPDPPAVVEKVREVARLETLSVRTYKKVTYEVDPPAAESLWTALRAWTAHAVDPPVGSAIVFADAHLSLDMNRLDAGSLRVEGERVTVALPPIVTRVELRPGETEVIRSNLDSAQTAELLDRAKFAIEADVAADSVLHARARAGAEAAIERLLRGMGFERVRFVGEPGA